MNKLRLRKEVEIRRIEGSFKASNSFFVTAYKGLKVSALEELRGRLRSHAEVKVCKNRLLKIAATNAGLSGLEGYLKGQNIFIFSEGDGGQVAKLLYDFSKENKELVLVAGLYEGRVIDAKGVEEVAMLPTFPEALARLSGSLINPIQSLALGLQMLADRGSNAAA